MPEAQVVMAVRLLHPWREEEWEKIGSPDLKLILNLVDELPVFEIEDEEVLDEKLEEAERELRKFVERLKQLGFQVFQVFTYPFIRISDNTLAYVTYMLDEEDGELAPVIGIVYFPSTPPALQRRILEEFFHVLPDYYDPCYEVVVYQNGEFEYRRVEESVRTIQFEELLERCPHLKEWLDDRGLLPDEDARWLRRGEHSLGSEVAERLRVARESEMYNVKVEWFTKCSAVAIHAWHVDGNWDMVVIFDISNRQIFAWEWEG